MNFYWVTSWSADGDSLIDRQWSAFIILAIEWVAIFQAKRSRLIDGWSIC